MEISKEYLKKALPQPVLSSIRFIRHLPEELYIRIKIRQAQANQKKALERIRGKKIIKVAFLLIHEAVWKLESVYMLMEQDPLFDPIIVVCPYIRYGKETMLREMEYAYRSFKRNHYNVVRSLNWKTGQWLDVKNIIDPDIVFFTNPHSLTKPDYLVENYLHRLTCYVPYGFKNSYLYQAHFNKPMQNLVWKFFIETKIHKRLSEKYSRNKGSNAVVTGYPGMDKFLIKAYRPKDVWKIKNSEIKRIIWAPHHTIPQHGATLDYSNFYQYCDYMFFLAEKYKDRIQIAFKPHPLLRPKLSLKEVWGKEKTDNYYERWANLPNGQLCEGEYIDLFLTSDGMLHDSSSFVIEYLYTEKPVMFLINNDSIYCKFNELGRMALDKLYHGKSRKDVDNFIKRVIIDHEDNLKQNRIAFFKSFIQPPNNMTASENICNILKHEINVEPKKCTTLRKAT